MSEHPGRRTALALLLTLAAGTAAPTPVPAGGALVLDLPTSGAEPASLDAYRLDQVTGTSHHCTTEDPTSAATGGTR